MSGGVAASFHTLLLAYNGGQSPSLHKSMAFQEKLIFGIDLSIMACAFARRWAAVRFPHAHSLVKYRTMPVLKRAASIAAQFDAANTRTQFQQVLNEIADLVPGSSTHLSDTQAGFSALLRWASQMPADAMQARQAAREAVRSALQRSHASKPPVLNAIDDVLVSYIRTFGRGAASEPLWVLSLALHVGHWPSQRVADAAATCLMDSGHTDTALKLLLSYPDLGHVHSDACVNLLHRAIGLKTSFAHAKGDTSSTTSTPPSSELGQAIVDMLLASFQSIESDSSAAAGVLKALLCSAAHGSEAAATAAPALLGHLAKAAVRQRANKSGSRAGQGVDVATVLQVTLEYAQRLVVRHHASIAPPLHTQWDPRWKERHSTGGEQHDAAVPAPPPVPPTSTSDPPPPPPAMAASLPTPIWAIPDPDVETTVCKVAESLVSAALAASPAASTAPAGGQPPLHTLVRNSAVSPASLAALLGIFTVCNVPSRARQLLPMLRVVRRESPFDEAHEGAPDEGDWGGGSTATCSALKAASTDELRSLCPPGVPIASDEGVEGGVRPWLAVALTGRYASATLHLSQYIHRAGIHLTRAEQTSLARAAAWQWQALRITGDAKGVQGGTAEAAAAANALRQRDHKGARSTARKVLLGGVDSQQGLTCPACGVAGQKGGGKKKRRDMSPSDARAPTQCPCLDRSGTSAAPEHSDDEAGPDAPVAVGATARAARRASNLWPGRFLGAMPGASAAQADVPEAVLQPLLLASAATPCVREAEAVFQLLAGRNTSGNQRARKAAQARHAVHSLWRWWATLHGGSPQGSVVAWRCVADAIAPAAAREMSRRQQHDTLQPDDLHFVADLSISEQQRIGASLMVGHAWLYLHRPSPSSCCPADMLRVGEANIARTFGVTRASRDASTSPSSDRVAVGSALVRAFAAAACRCAGLPVDTAHQGVTPVAAMKPGAWQLLAVPPASPLGELLQHDLQRGMLALDKY